MGATASTAAGATHTGRPRTAATNLPRATAAAAGPAPALVDSLTIAGGTRNVSEARAFVARTLGAEHPCADEAVLLCSELVTNAVLHSESGQPGGTVTVVVLGFPGAVRIEVVDNGSTRTHAGGQGRRVRTPRARPVPGRAARRALGLHP